MNKNDIFAYAWLYLTVFFAVGHFTNEIAKWHYFPAVKRDSIFQLKKCIGGTHEGSWRDHHPENQHAKMKFGRRYPLGDCMFLLGFGWFVGVSFQGCARLVDTCTYALNLCAEKRRGRRGHVSMPCIWDSQLFTRLVASDAFFCLWFYNPY